MENWISTIISIVALLITAVSLTYQRRQMKSAEKQKPHDSSLNPYTTRLDEIIRALNRIADEIEKNSKP